MSDDAKEIPLGANILGLIGTICWCVQLIPQIWVNWSRRGTDGLNLVTFSAWVVAAIFFGPYAIDSAFNIPVQIQPQAWLLLCLVVALQILYYDRVSPMNDDLMCRNGP